MKSQRKHLRHILVPFLSVFLMLTGLGIPVSAEESNPPETEQVNEPIGEETPEEEIPEGGEEETKEESDPSAAEETPGNEVKKEDREGIDGEKEDAEALEEAEANGETEEKTPETEEAEEEGSEALGENETASRTILFYLCGTDLETDLGAAARNLMQILSANFSKDRKIRFIVMTGGTSAWHVKPSNLIGEDGSPVESISTTDNQIWECFGADEEDERFRSKMVLLTDQTGFNTTDLMTNYQNLINFIDYGYKNFPADSYDLIMWDHGSGMAGAFGNDDRRKSQYDAYRRLTAEWILYALKNNKLTKDGRQFEILNFDACLMGSLEMVMAFAPYMRYYIGSALPIPQYGEEYKGWLDQLGASPDMDSHTLGKCIVDAFEVSYEKRPEIPYKTVLSVIDVRKFLDSSFLGTFRDMESVLREEAVTPRDPDGTVRFYDELNSADSILSYSDKYYVDVGQLASALGIAMKEVTLDDITPQGEINDRNLYTDVVYPIWNIMADQSLIYTKSTGGLASDFLFYRDGNRDVYFDQLNSTGLSVFFPAVGTISDTVNYLMILEDVLKQMPEDPVKAALKEHFRNTARYALILGSGYAVSKLDDYGRSSGIIGPEAKITLEDVISWWKRDPGDDDDSDWDEYYSFLFQYAEESEAEVKSWLRNVVNQQCDETVQSKDVSSTAIITPEGTAHQIKIENTKKRALVSIQTKMTAELPVMMEYIESHPEIKRLAEMGADFMISVGELEAEMEDPPAGKGEEYLREYIRWLNDSTSIWNSPPETRKWFGVKDAENRIHMAMLYETDTGYEATATIRIAGTDTFEPVTLQFNKDQILTGYNRVGEGDAYGEVDAKSMLKEAEVMMVNLVVLNNSKWVALPISEKTFTLSSSNYSNITIDMYELDDIPDIHDDEGGEYKTDYRVTVKNIYGYEKEITEEVIDNPTDVLTDIRCAEMQKAVFTGQEQTPVLMYLDNVLKEGKDYDLFRDSDHMIDVGTYGTTVYGKGDFTGQDVPEFEIRPASMTKVTADAIEDQVYTGSEICPVPKLELITETAAEADADTNSAANEAGNRKFTYSLVKDRDYTASYADNINVGEAKLNLTGIGNFTDTDTMTFKIIPCPINSKAVTIQTMEEQTYTGSPIEAKPTILFNGKTLSEGEDYTLAWTDNTDAGKASVTITGIGNFSGTDIASFNITPLAVDSDSIIASKINDQDYTGKAVTPKPVLSFNGKELKEKEDYTLSYTNNTFPGKAEITVIGKGDFKGTRTIPFVISPCPADSDLVTIPEITDKAYTGKPVEPKPRVLLNGKELKEGADYTLQYRDNVEIGTGIITIHGLGSTLSGSREITFRIVKANPKPKPASDDREDHPFIPLPQIFRETRAQTVPNTRDNNEIGFWACLHVLSLAGIIGSYMALKKRVA